MNYNFTESKDGIQRCTVTAEARLSQEELKMVLDRAGDNDVQAVLNVWLTLAIENAMQESRNLSKIKSGLLADVDE